MHRLIALAIISVLFRAISGLTIEKCDTKFCFILVYDDEAESFDDTKASCEDLDQQLLILSDGEIRGSVLKFQFSLPLDTINSPVFIDMKRTKTDAAKFYMLNSAEFQGDMSDLDESQYDAYGALISDAGLQPVHKATGGKSEGNPEGKPEENPEGNPEEDIKYLVSSWKPELLKPYICEFDVSACESAKGDRFVYSDRCLVKYESDYVSWFEARSRCYFMGGDLASVDYKGSAGLATSAFFDVLNMDIGEEEGYWVGVRYRNMSWMSPSGGNKEMIYNGWSRKPMYNLEYDCACLDPKGDPPWSWSDCDCSATLPFLCFKWVDKDLENFMKAYDVNPDDTRECNCTEYQMAVQQKGFESPDMLVGLILAIIIPLLVAILLSVILFYRDESDEEEEETDEQPKANEDLSVAGGGTDSVAEGEKEVDQK